MRQSRSIDFCPWPKNGKQQCLNKLKKSIPVRNHSSFIPQSISGRMNTPLRRCSSSIWMEKLMSHPATPLSSIAPQIGWFPVSASEPASRMRTSAAVPDYYHQKLLFGYRRHTLFIARQRICSCCKETIVHVKFTEGFQQTLIHALQKGKQTER